VEHPLAEVQSIAEVAAYQKWPTAEAAPPARRSAFVVRRAIARLARGRPKGLFERAAARCAASVYFA